LDYGTVFNEELGSLDVLDEVEGCVPVRVGNIDVAAWTMSAGRDHDRVSLPLEMRYWSTWRRL
jgi:hypothetical protein